jgi:DNA-binding MarR family transcriptional regulator
MSVIKFSGNGDFPPLLHLSYVLQHTADAELLSEARVGLSQVRIMSGLSNNSPRSQRYLSAELNQTEANISRQLKVMKSRGLVSITKNKKDGRQRDVTLTSKGRQKYQKARKLLNKQQAEIFRMLKQGESEVLEFAAQKLAKQL